MTRTLDSCFVRQRIYQALGVPSRFLPFFQTWAVFENLSFGATTFANLAGCDDSETGGAQKVARFLDFYRRSGLNLGLTKRKKGQLTRYGSHRANLAAVWVLKELETDPHPNPIVGCDTLTQTAIERFSLLKKKSKQEEAGREGVSIDRSYITGDIGSGHQKKRKPYRIGPLLERGESAIQLAREGFRVATCYGVRDGVCLCRKGAECPSAGKHWSVQQPSRVATSHQPLIRDLFIKRPQSNIGILTGERLPQGGFLLGMDIDPRSFGGGVLFQLERDIGPLPVTRRHDTASGGFHLLFSTPTRLQSKNGILGRGIDVKCLGGMLIGPGSVGVNGGEYSRKNQEPIAELPQDWLKRILAIWTKKAPLIGIGDRHNHLIKWAGGIVRVDGFRGNTAFEILKDRRDKRCELGPPFISDDKLREMIRYCEEHDQQQGAKQAAA